MSYIFGSKEPKVEVGATLRERVAQNLRVYTERRQEILNLYIQKICTQIQNLLLDVSLNKGETKAVFDYKDIRIQELTEKYQGMKIISLSDTEHEIIQERLQEWLTRQGIDWKQDSSRFFKTCFRLNFCIQESVKNSTE